jgi:HEAT repeat protein
MRVVTCCFAITLLVASCAKMPPRQPAPLDPHVIASVDRVYPGFAEVLQSLDSRAFARLAAVLSANPSPESLSVLLWMLQYGPFWGSDSVPEELQIDRVARAVGSLPLAPISGTLLSSSDADQRITAAALLSNGGVSLIPADERESVQKVLIAALSDPNIHVRELAAGTLRILGTVEGEAALVQSLNDPNVTETYFWQALDQQRPLPGAKPGVPAFPPSTVAVLRAINPNFLEFLVTRNHTGVRQLIAGIERSKNPDTTPVLVWLLANGDISTYGGVILNRLTEPPHRDRLPIADLASLLATADPDRRLAITKLLAGVLRVGGTQIPPGDRERIIAALIDRVRDPNIDVSIEAAQALGVAQVTTAVGALTSALDRPDVMQDYASTVIQSLASIGSREALPTLERWARLAATVPIREVAAAAFIAIAKPADPASEARRLLWEKPNTNLEQTVLRQGQRALPLPWKALTSGSERERRASAALLGWFPDAKSISPILTALSTAPGALTREQLLFDLNMIVLVEGSPADVSERNALAAAHLRWLYDQVANQPIDSDIRSAVLSQRTIAVFPDRIVGPFSVDLSTRSSGDGPDQPVREFSATAVRSESPQAFHETVTKGAVGVAFHAIAVAEGVARVATTLYLGRGRIANQVWISLYRNEGGQWVPLKVPSHPVLHRMLNEPNLQPTINRDYGADHPLKTLRLDLTMERIRVDLNERRALENENIEKPFTRSAIDSSYVRLLERYKRSDAPSVKYTAEFESARLTGQPNVQLWTDTLAQQPGTPFQAMAQQVVAGYALRQIQAEGRGLTGAERDQLVAAAVSPEPVDPLLLPQSLPRAENIRQVRQSSRFGLVDAVFGSGPLGMNGYSMLFERRGERWVFLCIVKGWTS